MAEDAADAARRRRRILRLGALLFQLRYYMAERADIAAHIYRRDATTYVQVVGGRVLFAHDATRAWLDLDAAIARCKEALREGRSLHEG